MIKSTRKTVAKTLILDIITKSNVALSHSEIHNLTDGICDRVTIYRVLDSVAESSYQNFSARPMNV